jgi:pimeloyl-ACP methyl ester carboxylesterase
MQPLRIIADEVERSTLATDQALEEPFVIILAGTAAVRPVALAYYLALRHFGHCQALYVLPRAGLGDLVTEEADFERWLALQRLDPKRPLICVGHSQGALVATHFGALSQGGPRTVKVIAISAPYNGTIWARLIPFLPAGRDMSPGSLYLEQLRTSLVDPDSWLTTISTEHELVVLPRSSCRPAYGSRHVQLPGGHISGIFQRQLWQIIREHSTDRTTCMN